MVSYTGLSMLAYSPSKPGMSMMNTSCFISLPPGVVMEVSSVSDERLSFSPSSTFSLMFSGVRSNWLFLMLWSEASFSMPRRVSMMASICSTRLVGSSLVNTVIRHSSPARRCEMMEGRTVHSRKWVGLT